MSLVKRQNEIETQRKKRADMREHCIFYAMHQMNTSGRTIRTPHISMARDSVPPSWDNICAILLYLSPALILRSPEKLPGGIIR
jgi:hypothetical protein